MLRHLSLDADPTCSLLACLQSDRPCRTAPVPQPAPPAGDPESKVVDPDLLNFAPNPFVRAELAVPTAAQQSAALLTACVPSETQVPTVPTETTLWTVLIQNFTASELSGDVTGSNPISTVATAKIPMGFAWSSAVTGALIVGESMGFTLNGITLTIMAGVPSVRTVGNLVATQAFMRGTNNCIAQIVVADFRPILYKVGIAMIAGYQNTELQCSPLTSPISPSEIGSTGVGAFMQLTNFSGMTLSYILGPYNSTLKDATSSGSAYFYTEEGSDGFTVKYNRGSEEKTLNLAFPNADAPLSLLAQDNVGVAILENQDLHAGGTYVAYVAAYPLLETQAQTWINTMKILNMIIPPSSVPPTVVSGFFGTALALDGGSCALLIEYTSVDNSPQNLVQAAEPFTPCTTVTGDPLYSTAIVTMTLTVSYGSDGSNEVVYSALLTLCDEGTVVQCLFPSDAADVAVGQSFVYIAYNTVNVAAVVFPQGTLGQGLEVCGATNTAALPCSWAMQAACVAVGTAVTLPAVPAKIKVNYDVTALFGPPTPFFPLCAPTSIPTWIASVPTAGWSVEVGTVTVQGTPWNALAVFDDEMDVMGGGLPVTITAAGSSVVVSWTSTGSANVFKSSDNGLVVITLAGVLRIFILRNIDDNGAFATKLMNALSSTSDGANPTAVFAVLLQLDMVNASYAAQVSGWSAGCPLQSIAQNAVVSSVIPAVYGPTTVATVGAKMGGSLFPPLVCDSTTANLDNLGVDDVTVSIDWKGGRRTGITGSLCMSLPAGPTLANTAFPLKGLVAVGATVADATAILNTWSPGDAAPVVPADPPSVPVRGIVFSDVDNFMVEWSLGTNPNPNGSATSTTSDPTVDIGFDVPFNQCVRFMVAGQQWSVDLRAIALASSEADAAAAFVAETLDNGSVVAVAWPHKLPPAALGGSSRSLRVDTWEIEIIVAKFMNTGLATQYLAWVNEAWGRDYSDPPLPRDVRVNVTAIYAPTSGFPLCDPKSITEWIGSFPTAGWSVQVGTDDTLSDGVWNALVEFEPLEIPQIEEVTITSADSSVKATWNSDGQASGFVSDDNGLVVLTLAGVLRIFILRNFDDGGFATKLMNAITSSANKNSINVALLQLDMVNASYAAQVSGSSAGCDSQSLSQNNVYSSVIPVIIDTSVPVNVAATMSGSIFPPLVCDSPTAFLDNLWADATQAPAAMPVDLDWTGDSMTKIVGTTVMVLPPATVDPNQSGTTVLVKGLVAVGATVADATAIFNTWKTGDAAPVVPADPPPVPVRGIVFSDVPGWTVSWALGSSPTELGSATSTALEPTVRIQFDVPFKECVLFSGERFKWTADLRAIPLAASIQDAASAFSAGTLDNDTVVAVAWPHINTPSTSAWINRSLRDTSSYSELILAKFRDSSEAAGYLRWVRTSWSEGKLSPPDPSDPLPPDPTPEPSPRGADPEPNFINRTDIAAAAVGSVLLIAAVILVVFGARGKRRAKIKP